MYTSTCTRPPHQQRELCIPANPGGRDAVNRKHSELEVLSGARGLAAVPPSHVGGGGLRGGRRGGGAEGSQVELGQLVDGVCQGGHALLHRTTGACGRVKTTGQTSRK